MFYMEFTEYALAALNPATGTQLPIPLFIISGIVLVGCVVAAIVAKKLKGNKGYNKKKKK